MKTNLENYEERFVDYMEGLLNAEEMHEVEAFVAQHPELEEDFKLFCCTKLEPDTSVVFTKKESLMRPTTTIRPLFVRIVAAAACVALLIGVGIRFLRTPHAFEKQPILANITPIEAHLLDIPETEQGLRRSQIKVTPIPKSVVESETMTSTVLIATMEPLAYQQLTGNTSFDDIDSRMFTELEVRLASLEPISNPIPMVESTLSSPKEQLLTSLQDSFLSNVRQTTKDLYKRTAKTVMDVYYTADYCINEAKSSIDVRRELVIPQ